MWGIMLIFYKTTEDYLKLNLTKPLAAELKTSRFGFPALKKEYRLFVRSGTT